MPANVTDGASSSASEGGADGKSDQDEESFSELMSDSASASWCTDECSKTLEPAGTEARLAIDDIFCALAFGWLAFGWLAGQKVGPLYSEACTGR